MNCKTEYTYDLFVSYAKADHAWVKGYLLPALGLPPEQVITPHDIRPGAPVAIEFERAVSDSRYTVLVLSPAYLADEWANFSEQLTSYASVAEQRDHLIPLLLRSCTLPLHLGFRVRLDCTDEANWEDEVTRLRALLNQPGPTPEYVPCPYPGMVPFGEADSDRFFGRHGEIQELLQKLRLHPLLAVVGPSGSGKSSLVFAGLVPALRKSGLFDPGGWLVRTMRPGESPLDALTSALDGDPADPAVRVSELLSLESNARHLLLVVDQLEELFTLAKSDVKPFQQVLLHLAEVSNCYVVLTARADFYPELMAAPLWEEIKFHRVEVQTLDENGLRQAIVQPAKIVGVFVEGELMERLVADAAGERGSLPLIQETLVLLWEKLKRRLLPLDAYEALGDSKRTGLQVAIAHQADAVLADLTAEQQAIARRIFLRLVQFGEGRADIRRQQLTSALRAVEDAPLLFDQTLRYLTDNRLLTLSGEEGEPESRMDIAHEALIDGWPKLRRWIDERREAEQTRRRLEAKASEWVRMGRGEGGLLDEVELLDAEHWLASSDAADLRYSEELPALVETSRTAQEEAIAQQRRTARFRLGALGAIAMLVIMALGLGLWAALRDAASKSQLARQQEEAAATAQTYAADQRILADAEATARAEADARQADAEAAKEEAVASQEVAEHQAYEARVALSRQLAMQARGTLSEFPQRSLLLAVEALNITSEVGEPPVAAAREALWQALEDPTIGRLLASHGEAITAIALSQDDHWLAAGSEDNTVYLWDLTVSDQLIAPTILSGHSDDIRSVAISPDSHWLVTGSDDKTARLWDLYSEYQVSSSIVLSQSATVDRIVISPDSHWLLTVSENDARLWNLTVSDPAAASISLADYEVAVVAFSSDSRWLAAGGGGKLEVDAEGVTTAALSEGQGQAIQLWDLTSSSPPTASFVLSGHDEAVCVAAFSPDNHWLATGSWDDNARLWDLRAEDPATQSVILPGHEEAIIAITISPDSHWLVTGSMDFTARLWDLTASDPAATATILPGHVDWVNATVFSPDGRWLATSSSWDNTVHLWDLTALDRSKELQLMQCPTDQILNITFSPNGTWLAAHSRDAVVLWAFSAGNPTPVDPRILRANEKGLGSVVSLNSKWLATGSKDGAVRLWDLTDVDRAALPTVLPGFRWEKAIAISPDSHWLVTHSSWLHIVGVWNLAGLKAWPTILTDSEHVATSGDSRWLVTSSQDCATCVRSLEYTDSPTCSTAIPSERIIAASTDNHWLVVGDVDQAARLWDLTASEPTAAAMVLPGYAGGISAASISPDNRWLVTQKRNTVRLWDLRAEDPATEFIELPHDNVGSYSIALTFSPDSRWLATTFSLDLYLWDLTATNPAASKIWLRDGRGDFQAIAFSTDGHWLIIGVTASPLPFILLDLTAEDLAATAARLPGHRDLASAVAFSPDDHWLATGSKDGVVYVWDMTTEDPTSDPHVLSGHTGSVSTVAFAADNHWLVTIGQDESIQLWDLTAEDPAVGPRDLTGHEHGFSITAVSPKGGWLVTRSWGDSSARIWDLDAKEPFAASTLLPGHEGWINSVAFSADDHWLITNSDDSSRLWDLTDLNSKPSVLPSFEGTISAFAISTDNRWLVTTAEATAVRLWNLAANDFENPAIGPIILPGSLEKIQATIVTSETQWLVTSAPDNTVRLWDWTSPAAEPVALYGHEGIIGKVNISPDNRWLVASGDWRVRSAPRLWDLATGDLAIEPFILAGHNEGVRAVTFSSDSHWLVTGGTSQDSAARLWDLAAEDPTASPMSLPGHGSSVSAVAISYNNHWVATSSQGTIYLWDLTVPAPDIDPIILRGHRDYINTVAFSYDSHWLATQGTDNTIRLWDLTTAGPNAESVILNSYEGTISNIMISPDNYWLVAHSGSGPIQLWILELDELLDLACHTAGRNLTFEEWRRYFPQQDYRKTCSNLPFNASDIQSILETARELAMRGDVEGAVDEFQRALEKEPSLGIDPKMKAHQYAAQGMIEKAVELASEGAIEQSIAICTEAQALDPALEISAWTWRDLCWYGSFFGHATDVMYTCEKAVQLKPDNGTILESRGLARASTGDYQGAIDDFKSYVEWARTNGWEFSSREAWIAQLEAGQNPFSAATLERLRLERLRLLP